MQQALIYDCICAVHKQQFSGSKLSADSQGADSNNATALHVPQSCWTLLHLMLLYGRCHIRCIDTPVVQVGEVLNVG